MNWQLQKEKGKKEIWIMKRFSFHSVVSEGGKCTCFISEITAAENISRRIKSTYCFNFEGIVFEAELQ